MSTHLDKRKVLIVEDDLTLKTVLTKLLHSIDPTIEIEWATTVDEVMAELGRKSATYAKAGYDLIIADIFTPGMTNGYDLWEACQKRFPEVPILITSGTSVYDFLRAITVKEQLARAAPPFLEKPLALGQCKQVIQYLLGYPSERQEAG